MSSIVSFIILQILYKENESETIRVHIPTNRKKKFELCYF